MAVAERVILPAYVEGVHQAESFLRNPPEVIFVLDDYRGPDQHTASDTSRIIQATQASLVYHNELYADIKPQVVVLQKKYPKSKEPQKTINDYLLAEQVDIKDSLSRKVPPGPISTVLRIRAFMQHHGANSPAAVIVPEDQKSALEHSWKSYFKANNAPAPVLHVLSLNSPVYNYLRPNPSEETVFNDSWDIVKMARGIRARKNVAPSPLRLLKAFSHWG